MRALRIIWKRTRIWRAIRHLGDGIWWQRLQRLQQLPSLLAQFRVELFAVTLGGVVLSHGRRNCLSYSNLLFWFELAFEAKQLL